MWKMHSMQLLFEQCNISEETRVDRTEKTEGGYTSNHLRNGIKRSDRRKDS
jgi:hypothetical protein